MTRNSKRIAVYTAIFGGYDSVKEPQVHPEEIDYYLITDDTSRKDANSAWTYVDITNFANTIKPFSNQMKNRFFKMHPHLLFADYEYSVYLDGNYGIVGNLVDFTKNVKEYDLATYKHVSRNCVYDEAEFIKKAKKADPESIDNHISHLKDNDMPKDYGLPGCGIIVRRHTDMSKSIMDFWWDEYQKYSIRDQVSMPYVLFKMGIPVDKITTLGDQSLVNNPHVQLDKHMKYIL